MRDNSGALVLVYGRGRVSWVAPDRIRRVNPLLPSGSLDTTRFESTTLPPPHDSLCKSVDFITRERTGGRLGFATHRLAQLHLFQRVCNRYQRAQPTRRDRTTAAGYHAREASVTGGIVRASCSSICRDEAIIGNLIDEYERHRRQGSCSDGARPHSCATRR
jgi:hypothetical protein